MGQNMIFGDAIEYGASLKKFALGGIRTLNPLRASHFKCDSYTSSDTRAWRVYFTILESKMVARLRSLIYLQLKFPKLGDFTALEYTNQTLI